MYMQVGSTHFTRVGSSPCATLKRYGSLGMSQGLLTPYIHEQCALVFCAMPS